MEKSDARSAYIVTENSCSREILGLGRVPSNIVPHPGHGLLWRAPYPRGSILQVTGIIHSQSYWKLVPFSCYPRMPKGLFIMSMFSLLRSGSNLASQGRSATSSLESVLRDEARYCNRSWTGLHCSYNLHARPWLISKAFMDLY